MLQSMNDASAQWKEQIVLHPRPDLCRLHLPFRSAIRLGLIYRTTKHGVCAGGSRSSIQYQANNINGLERVVKRQLPHRGCGNDMHIKDRSTSYSYTATSSLNDRRTTETCRIEIPHGLAEAGGVGPHRLGFFSGTAAERPSRGLA